MEDPIFQIDDLVVPLFSETSISYSGDTQGCTRNPNVGPHDGKSLNKGPILIVGI